MLTQRKFSSRLTAVLLLASLAVAGCGAGAKTGAKTAEKTNCDFTAPAQDTKINLLVYNSSAIDPFTNTMVASCSHDKVTITHDPIDFPGQKTKTASTLAGSSGSYDIVETYSLVIPTYAAKLEPLDDLYTKYKDKYKLGDLDPTMVKGMSYGGHIYGLPTQANVTTMAFARISSMN